MSDSTDCPFCAQRERASASAERIVEAFACPTHSAPLPEGPDEGGAHDHPPADAALLRAIAADYSSFAPRLFRASRVSRLIKLAEQMEAA